jgi:DNA-binding response OmpR family regulator
VAAARADLSRADAQASERPRRNTVIIVDDEPAVRRFIGAVVQHMGLHGLEASSAGEVRSIAAQHTDAHVVLDLSLGEDDGINVMATLAAERFAGGIILISGHDDDLLRCARKIGAGMNLNIVSTLRKPFTLDELRGSLEAADTSSAAPTR